MTWLGLAITRLWKALSNDEGSATVEFVIAVPIIVSLAAVSVELGGALRVSSQLETAVRDASRILSITPADANGDLLPAGVDRAFALVRDRMRDAGKDVTLSGIPAAGAGTTCAADGAPCMKITEIPGSEAVFGRPRHEITLMAAVEVDTPLMMLFRDGVLRDGRGAVVVYAETSQMHFD